MTNELPGDPLLPPGVSQRMLDDQCAADPTVCCNCGGELEEDWAFCPTCGEDIEDRPAPVRPREALTAERLANVLIAHALIDQQAWDDAEDYDKGHTARGIALAVRDLNTITKT